MPSLDPGDAADPPTAAALSATAATVEASMPSPAELPRFCREHANAYFYTSTDWIRLGQRLVWNIGFGQQTVNVADYKPDTRAWLQDTGFWSAMDRDVDVWGQEAYPDMRYWGVADTPREARTTSVSLYLEHPLLLAENGPPTVSTALDFLERTYVPLASDAWQYESGFGDTDDSDLDMERFVSDEGEAAAREIAAPRPRRRRGLRAAAARRRGPRSAAAARRRAPVERADACRAATGRQGAARRGGTGRWIGFRCVVSRPLRLRQPSSGEQMKRGIGVVAALACVALSAAGSASAGEGVYYQDPVRADLPVSAPPTPSCTVALATDYATNDAGGAYHDFDGTFAPPADCPGPWAKVVLHFSAQEAGRQYDRAGEVAFGGAWIFFTSTPEPDPDGITWSVDKDVTEYSSLFTSGRPYTISVPNYLNSLITGVMHISASLTFYEPDAAHPAPAVPDAVVPLGTRYVSSGTPTNFPVSGLPRNIERAQLEVYPKGNSCDEFWYGGAPDAFAGANGLCGGGVYRELDAAVDGTPAGATLPFPDVFTGGVNPLIWRPIPAVDAFDLPPRTLDVTPFVGTLVDGGTHTISLAVANAQSYWGLTGNLLLWLDHGSTQTSGALVSDTLASGPAAATVSEQPGTGSDVWHTTASRSWTISGRVQTSHGVVTTTVDGAFDFANGNDLTVQNYRQNTTNGQTLHSVVTTADTTGTRRHAVDETDSIVAQDMFQEPPHADDWMLPAHVSVTKTVSVADTVNGAPAFSSSLTNTTAGSGVLSEFDSGLYRLANGADRQDYEYSDSTGVCYRHRISAAQGYVTSDHVDGTC